MLSIRERASKFLVPAVCLTYIGLFLDIAISNVTIILLLVLCLFIIKLENFLTAVKSNRSIFLLVCFYLLHVIGVLYSEDSANAFFVLEKKISLLLFPLILFPALSTLSQSRKSNLIFYIGIITATSGLILLAIAVFKKYVCLDALAFHKDYFSSIHYVFYSIYFAVGSLLLLHSVYQRFEGTKNTLLILVVIAVYSLEMLVIISSKMGILAYVGGLVYFLYVKIASRKVFYISSIGVVLCLSLFLVLYPATLNRFTELNRNMELLSKDQLSDYEEFTGLNLRLYFWKASITQLWQDGHFIEGIGTGDSQNYLNVAYQRHHLDKYGYEGFDAHNQWMMTLLQLGMIGVCLLTLVFITGLSSSIKNGNLDWQFFAWIIFSFMITESVLEANKGVVYISLFFCILSDSSVKKEIKLL